MNAIKFLLGIQIKRSKLVQERGFTLIELLVAMIIATLVITPLLGFMINILNTDRQEQVKANSEQEIQTALDYISRDLQQAVYIYDVTGINTLVSATPTSTTTSQLPVVTNGVPVLVFWKREFLNQALTAAANNEAGSNKDDTFVYSLVAYYLIKDTNATWSNAARIARWQIRDGVAASSGGVDCPGYTGKYVTDYCPSAGFAPFNLEGVGTIEQKMNSWKKLGSYTTTTETNGTKTTQTTTVTQGPPIVLVDYIDQTTTGAPSATCASGSKVPQDVTNLSSITTVNMTSFYACVDRVNTTAQVFLRGNALARLRNNNLSYADSRKTYFPTASIRVQGRGFLFTK
jgi:prepilin-type N-terminal cleavage/methylation domain-containing protein